ncbi:hypothetical protein GRAN_4781 [Granulicella sibirica]|uniref:Uncharacterized protein n=1 Tax=Granulicella sibirica TaxID=2479048 RepID=A0A4Q0SW47_9BACT|nr:hypothetical protein GRAN_4781 [Granulicella sibirica]
MRDIGRGKARSRYRDVVVCRLKVRHAVGTVLGREALHHLVGSHVPHAHFRIAYRRAAWIGDKAHQGTRDRLRQKSSGDETQAEEKKVCERESFHKGVLVSKSSHNYLKR